MPELVLPSPAEEADDPAGADVIYRACADYLREATRDRERFPLVFAELVSYGFRRNTWGMRPAGIILAFLGVLISAGIFLYRYGVVGELSAVSGAAAVVNAALLVLWLLRITPEWVRVVADEYAKRLMATCETLDPEKRLETLGAATD